MDVDAISGAGYLLIGGLILIGGACLVVSLIVNGKVATAAAAEQRRQEKLNEYRRNLLSQLGVILIGIGVSLSIFFVQQSYQEQQRYAAEVRQLLAKVSVRVGRAATVANWLIDFDGVIRYAGDEAYDVKTGAELAKQVRDILVVEREVDLNEAKAVTISDDIATSPLAGDIDPVLWFAITEDESEVFYGAHQLEADYADLHEVLGGQTPEAAVADPERAKLLATEVGDIYFDMDVLRDRARRLIGRGCRFVSAGPNFINLEPIAALEANYPNHIFWIDKAREYLSTDSVGGQTCFEMLKYLPEGRPE